MYDYDYGYGYGYDYGSTTSTIGIFAGVGIVMWIIGMAVAVFSLICMWKLFKKAGKPGWASIVPIYNFIVMIEIAELPMWYIALFFVPFANIYAMFKIYIEIAHKFGKSTGFGVAMVFFSFICIPILAFGKSQYKADNNVSVANNVNLQSNVTMPEQFNSNANINMQNVNSQFNVMDVNSGMSSGQVYDTNVQGGGNMFQPVGNINNNAVNMMDNNIGNTENVAVPVMPVNSGTLDNQPAGSTVSDNNLSQNVMPSANIPQNMNQAPSMNNNAVNNNFKFCSNCGNQVDSNVMYCPRCGNNVQ